MVNVAGRSKGCHTCRRRHKTCDQRKPTCLRCEKAGLVCGGYQKVYQFITVFPENSTTPQDDRAPSADSLVALATRVPAQLSLAAFRDDMSLTFMFENFVWRTYGTPWLEQAAAGKVDPLSFKACQALATLNFGKYHHLPYMEAAACGAYGGMLNVLATEICQPRYGVQSFLIPVLVMLLYSSLALDRIGVHSHLQGLSKILVLCGPQGFQKQPLLSALESLRATLVTTHLIYKKRLFLESEEWQTLPWARTQSRRAENDIVDILVTVPGLMEDVGRHLALPDPAPPVDIVSRVSFQLQKLFSWRWGWEELHSRNVKEVSRSPTNATAAVRQHQACKKALEFDSPRRATELMTYNATFLLLLGILRRVDPSSVTPIVEKAAGHDRPKDIAKMSPLYRPAETFTLRGPATEICRCYEYQVEHRGSGPNSSLFYLFPLALAGMVLKEDAMFTVWIRNMLDTSPVTTGYGVDQSNVYGFGHYLTSESICFS